MEPHCGGLDAAAGRIVSSPTTSSVAAAVRCSAPSGCEEDVLGTEGHHPWAAQPPAASGTLVWSSIYPARCSNTLLFFNPEKPPEYAKGNGNVKAAAFQTSARSAGGRSGLACATHGGLQKPLMQRGGLKKQSDARYRPARLVRTSPVSRGTRSGAKPATKLITRTSFFFFFRKSSL